MKENKINVGYLNLITGFEFKEIENSLEEFYKLIDCDYIDITEKKINGVNYDIIVDDEGLLKENFIFSGWYDFQNLKPCLAGNLIICHYDLEGNQTSITKEEFEALKKNTFLCQKLTAEGLKTFWGIDNLKENY